MDKLIELWNTPVDAVTGFSLMLLSAFIFIAGMFAYLKIKERKQTEEEEGGGGKW